MTIDPRGAMVVLSLSALAACGGGGGGGSAGAGSIPQPSGTILVGAPGFSPAQTSPSNPFTSSSTATAFAVSESGYGGNFTEQIIAQSSMQIGSTAATCFTIQQGTPLFVVNANGLLCLGGFNGSTATIQITDSFGNSTLLYFRLT